MFFFVLLLFSFLFFLANRNNVKEEEKLQTQVISNSYWDYSFSFVSEIVKRVYDITTEIYYNSEKKVEKLKVDFSLKKIFHY